MNNHVTTVVPHWDVPKLHFIFYSTKKTNRFQTTYLCTLISDNLGRPKLALVLVWGAPWWLWCHNRASANSGFRDESPVPAWGAQFQHGAPSSSTGRPVPARDMSQSHFWSQFQHGVPRCGTVPQRGC